MPVSKSCLFWHYNVLRIHLDMQSVTEKSNIKFINYRRKTNWTVAVRISSVSFLIYWETRFLGITMEEFIAVKNEANTEAYLDGFVFKNLGIIKLHQQQK